MLAGRAGRALVLGGLALALGAGAPVTSPRPEPRPVAAELPAGHPSQRAEAAGLGLILQDIFRPPARPQAGAIEAAVAAAILASPRPVPRPDMRRIVAAASTASSASDERAPRRGSVCGEREIRGEAIATIPGKLRGCGIAQPVRVTELSGVRLTQAAVMNCRTARILNDWVRRGVKPAVGRRGGGLEALKVIAHYSCRTRNSQPGARISEHGKGNALDISGIYLRNGDFISVLEEWKTRRNGKILRAMHASACGRFGTVLGPDADRYHRDHLHVDTASYRSGSYCR